ncbi:MAG TPA: hypothetical protein EYP85_04370 [Armatimonadetes bacterium]|nr:hypothetical protein [Armatimonadota bacterium]
MSREKLVLTVCLSLGVLFSFVALTARVRVEWRNRTVEVVGEYEEIAELAVGSGLPLIEVLERLRGAGLTSVAIEEDTLEALLNRGEVEVFGASGMEVTPAQEGPTLYLYADDAACRRRLAEQLRHKYPPGVVKEVTLSGEVLLQVADTRERLQTLGLGLSPRRVRQVQQAGLQVVARPRNYPGLTPAALEYMFNQLRKQGVTTVIFVGEEVLGWRGLIAQTAQALQGAGQSPTQEAQGRKIYWGQVEFAKQRGEAALGTALHGQILRVHSINVRELYGLTPTQAVARFVRAVKERNIRLCYVHLFLSPQEDRLAFNEAYLRALSRGLQAAGYRLGAARPFGSLEPPRWSVFLMGLGVLAAGLWLGGTFRPRPLPVLGRLLALGTLLWLALLLWEPLWGRKLLALAAALVFPTWAGLQVLSLEAHPDPRPPWPEIVKQATAGLWRVTGLTLVGALFVVGLLSQTETLVKVEQFSGVKVSLLLPILMVAAIYLLQLREPPRDVSAPPRRPLARRLAELYAQPLLLGHALTLVVALAVAFIFLVRTGNEGLSVSGWELKLRTLLENLLFARPRTKEFLLGHPALMLAFAAPLLNRPRWFLPALLVGMVGQVSTLNTFCHLHSPLYLSALRTFHALWLGTLGGSLLIGSATWFQSRKRIRHERIQARMERLE